MLQIFPLLCKANAIGNKKNHFREKCGLKQKFAAFSKVKPFWQWNFARSLSLVWLPFSLVGFYQVGMFEDIRTEHSKPFSIYISLALVRKVKDLDKAGDLYDCTIM